MTTYWIISIISILIQFFPIKNNKEYSIRLIFSLIPLFLFGALRVDFGLDYSSYEYYFNDVQLYKLITDSRTEIGYYYLNKFLPSFRSLLIFQSLLICTAYYYLFKWYVPAKYAWLGFLILLLSAPITIFFMLSGIRNGIAISIFILSTYYIHKRKIIPFAILVFIAYLFHNSILLIAPIAYFVANGKDITTKSIIIWLSVATLIILASTSILLDYVDMFITTYFDRYSTYVDFAKEQGKGAGILSLVYSLLISTMFLFIMKDKKMTMAENMIVNLTLLFFLSSLLGPLNMRMSQYFVSFFVVGSVLVVNNCTNKFLKITYFVAIFAFMLYSLQLWFESPYFSYDVYHSLIFN